jgi:hypothetical protein
MVALYLLAPVLNIWMVVEIFDGCIVLTGPCSEHLDGCRGT